ncbi:hypothetical protein VPH35_006507 [Triticum aestivum]|uniref:Uncharacterized protein n=1 Tax=Triticum turgidum subsp. durum TaxID=4567 RepID=A0A9R0QKJ8_TRITD|nr:unnamed protein product [Triticum turgidum subsp. durum]
MFRVNFFTPHMLANCAPYITHVTTLLHVGLCSTIPAHRAIRLENRAGACSVCLLDLASSGAGDSWSVISTDAGEGVTENDWQSVTRRQHHVRTKFHYSCKPWWLGCWWPW